MEKENSTFYLNSVNFYASNFKSTNLFSLNTLNKDYSDVKTIMRTFLRMGWLYLFEEKEENHDYPLINATIYDQLVNVNEGLKNLYDLAEFGKKYSKDIIEEVSSYTPDIAKIKSLSGKIDEIDELQEIVRQGYPLLAPIVDYFKVDKANLKGQNIVHLSESSFYSYHHCSSLCNIMFELIQKTVSEFKIKNTNYNTNEKESQGGQV